MVSVPVSNAVDCEFVHRSSQTKDYKIGICCFSAKQATLRRKSRDWLARNYDNVEQHVYPWIVVLMIKHYKNSTKRVNLVIKRTLL